MATGTPTTSGIKTIDGMEVISATDLNLVITSIDDIVGAAPSTLTTTAKTLVGAINEVDGDADVLKLRPWTENTDADTLGTGIYAITQMNDWQTLNYPAQMGVLLSFRTASYGLQIFCNISTFAVRTGPNPSNWNPWRVLTAV